ncbi:unnamed protein product [Boreogadus saida]
MRFTAMEGGGGGGSGRADGLTRPRLHGHGYHPASGPRPQGNLPPAPFGNPLSGSRPLRDYLSPTCGWCVHPHRLDSLFRDNVGSDWSQLVHGLDGCTSL